MDIKKKYLAFIGEKHSDIAYKLMNCDIETFAVEFGNYLLNNNSTTLFMKNKLSPKVGDTIFFIRWRKNNRMGNFI